MLETGTTVDRYTVERVLGQGGMAVVYQVRHDRLGSSHALKVLTVESRAITERMLQEGRVQASLRHPNIVAVHDVIEVAGQPGLLMEYVDGPALDAFLERGRPERALALALFDGVLGAVEHAHERGLVHRDLKPGNVMLQRAGDAWFPKVTDFGLAKLVEGDANLSRTRSGVAMGTPSYMSPEQIRDAKSVDARGDVFALGCILYELVTGEQAFFGEDILEIFNKVATGSYLPPRQLAPDLPDAVVAAIEGCLQVRKEDRIPDCATLRAVLRGASPPARRVRPDTFIDDAPGTSPTILPLEPEKIPAPRLDLTISQTSIDLDADAPPAPPPPNRRVALGLAAAATLGLALAAAGLWAMSSRLDPVDAPGEAPASAIAVEPAPAEPVAAEPPAAEPVAADPFAAEPVAAPVPAPSRPRPAPGPAAPALAPLWRGLANGTRPLVLEIDHQRAGGFGGTVTWEGERVVVRGTVADGAVSFGEPGGGRSWRGTVNAAGAWQGTWSAGEGRAEGQWLLTPQSR